MNDKEDEALAEALRKLLVPWDWEDVVLLKFDDAYLDWIKARDLLADGFYLHIEKPQIPSRPAWPYGDIITRHHYLFKDPANATAFALTFA